jgi:hypothetical protein
MHRDARAPSSTPNELLAAVEGASNRLINVTDEAPPYRSTEAPSPEDPWHPCSGTALVMATFSVAYGRVLAGVSPRGTDRRETHVVSRAAIRARRPRARRWCVPSGGQSPRRASR